MDLTLNEIKNELQISAELYESKRKALNTLDKIERLENTEKKIVALKAKTNVINAFNEFKYILADIVSILFASSSNELSIAYVKYV